MASIRKRKFGSDKEAWIVDYRDQHGKRHLKTFPNKKAAKDWTVNALYGWLIAKPTTSNSELFDNADNTSSIMCCRYWTSAPLESDHAAGL